MERLTKREKFDLGNGEEMVLCNYDDSNCNDSCMYVRPCNWMEEAKQKLWNYENAEENGLLLRLPCKVGDKVYLINHTFCENRKKPMQCVIDEFTFDKNNICYAILNGDVSVYMMRRFKAVKTEEFGKTVFLTKEEAEQALAEMR